MPNWDEIRQEWETTKITFSALAKKHDVPVGTLKSRRSREKWERDATAKDATATTDATGKGEKDATKRKRKVQRNRSGNPNPSQKFPERNSYALKHGLFSRYMPEETLNIMGMIAGSDPASLLWMQIELQFAAIIRAQQIMFVESREDITKELKREKRGSSDTGSSWEEEYEIQFAWDKHAAFMNAQSRAMGELRTSIRQFEELIDDETDERLLRLELMREQLEKAKLENSHMRGETEGDAHEQGSSYEEALNAQTEDVFADEVTGDAET